MRKSNQYMHNTKMSTSTSNPVTADSSTSTTIPAPTLTTNPKLARRLPCLPCQRRKVKCDRNEPCSNCVKGRVECVSPNPALPRKRKRRFAEAELLARLRRYEAYFIENGVDADTIGHTATDRALEREATTEASTPRVSLSVPRSPRTLKK